MRRVGQGDGDGIFSLGVGWVIMAPSHDTTVVVPMGGDLKLGKFYLTVLGDSVAFYMRNGHGRITMNRYNNELRRLAVWPEHGRAISDFYGLALW